MKQIWNGEEVIEVFSEEDSEVVAKYTHENLYFLMLRDKKTGELTTGWVEESCFDEVYVPMGLKREEFTPISNEKILNLVYNENSPG